MAEQHSDKKFEKKSTGPASIVTPFAELTLLFIGAVIIIPLLGIFFSSVWWSEFLAVFPGLFFGVKTTATIISMLGLLIAIYSFIRIHEITTEETKKLGVALTWEHERTEKNHRWERVEEHMRSVNPSDWKVAIMEADNMLDEVVKRMGYHGDTLGERMKNIEASDFPYLDEVWQAHKTRNRIAHTGTDFPISRSTAEDTVNIYYRTFKELGYL